MKDMLRSVVMAFAMFSRFPMPKVEWKQENMRYMLSFFPLVGAALGAVYALWWYISETLHFGDFLFAAGLTALPVLLTGGIHMDGFMDTVDALSSHGPLEKKRAILKDSHAGAFAVLYAVLYLIGAFALFTETKQARALIAPVCLIPVMSRGLSALASLSFPVYGKEEGLLKTFHEAGRKGASVFPMITLIVVLVIIGVTFPVLAFLWAAAGALLLVCIYRMSLKQFGGMSGDIAGFLLEIAEISLLFITILYKAVTA